MRCRIVIALFILLAPIGGISAQDSERHTLTVFAATSLTDVFESLREAFVEANDDAGILLNFSSSSTLAAQLDPGRARRCIRQRQRAAAGAGHRERLDRGRLGRDFRAQPAPP